MYFPLGDIGIDSIVNLSGNATFQEVMSGVTETRLIASPALPVIGADGPVGSPIPGTLKISNLSFAAMPEPMSATLLCVAIGAAAAHRRRG
ncbi:hypothetical protein KOR34_34170 [Posidoniimonas corsicana]|uniref:PEP-CTERM protein-sorting domain-containing protein n=1 Tax=Posidoniimonas corsicana TaxID=1938618 RepID=A0A5C5V777_9BACT|nr:hypothetical protein KOR34_34170 [Posidoniimonas corsicana]